MLTLHKAGPLGYARIATRTSRGAINAPSGQASGDDLSAFEAWGHDNANYRRATRITANVDAATGATWVPGRIGMWTTSTTGTETERVRLDSAGVVKINPLTDPAFPAAYTGQPGLLVQHEGTGQNNGLSLARAASETVSEKLTFWRSRGTWASKVAIANADVLGAIENWAWSGANWLTASSIRAYVSGTVTTTAVPTALDFLTADSAGTLATRLSIGPDGATAITGALTATVPAGSANPIIGESPMSLATGGQGQLVGQDTTAMAIDVGGVLTLRGKYTAAGAVAMFGAIKGGKSNATDGNLDTYLAFYTRSNATAITERLRIGATGLVGIGGMVGGAAVAQLDVMAVAAATPALYARAHASAAAALAYFQAIGPGGAVSLGANTNGVVTGVSQAKSSVTTVARAVPWYDVAGTFLGWMPLYSTSA
jgi:hypothetical protein